VIALALAATAAFANLAAPPQRPVLERPTLAKIAAAPQAIPDSTISASKAQRVLALGNYWGGKYSTPTGELVTVYVSDSYPQDQTIPQRWANFLDSLVHGSELSLVTAYLAPLDEVQTICGADALACYSPNDSLLVAPGDPPAADISAEAVVTHEYGHHVAAHRSDAPWAAVDYGTKRWASYNQVCAKTRAGKLFPGAESLPHYTLNPGEGFAESYRVLNQRKAGVVETPWDIVDQSLYPTAQSLSLLEQDVTTPWTKRTTTAYHGSLRSGTKSRTVSIPTGLDGSLRLDLRASSGVRLGFRVSVPSGKLVAKRTVAAAHDSVVSTTICGQRSFNVKVSRLRGAGAFSLSVTKP
jgi:hypothetical protein